jgi:hypothetical protein
MTLRDTGHGDRPTTESNRLPIKSAVLALVILLAGAAGMGAVAADNSLVDYDEVDNPRINESTLTVAEHEPSEMDSPLEYYDDNGDLQELPAHLDPDTKDPVGVRYDKLDTINLREFPRKSDEIDADDDGTANSASAVDADEWSTDATSTTGSIAVEDVTNHSVEGLRIEGSSIGTNEGGLVTYTNVSIDSDANKRVLTLVGRVEELNSAAKVNITVKEDDGDWKRAYIDSDLSSSSTDVAATQTANGVVYQVKLSDLTTEGTGDGTFNAIDELQVNVTDGDAEVVLTGIDAGRKTKLDLGTVRSDTDSDGDMEDKEIEQDADGGYNRLTGLGTMDTALSNATIADLEVHDVHYSMEDLPAGSDDGQNETHIAWSNASDYPSYAHGLDTYARLRVPTAIDLSHSGLTLEAEQQLLQDRYQTVEYAEDTGDTDFQNVSWSAAADSWDNQGDRQEFDASVTAGQNYSVHYFLTLTDSEKNSIESVESAGGGGGGPVDDGGGGILSNPITWIAGVVATAIGWAKGWLPFTGGKQG